MRNTQRYIIPPDPLRFGALLVCFFGTLPGAILGARSSSVVIADPWFICLVAGIEAIIFSKNYIFDDNGFTERILLFPRHRFSWKNVGEVLVFEKSNDDPRTKGECIIVITSSGCERFSPERETIGAYIKRYTGFVTKIVVSKKKKERYIAMLEDTFGTVVVFE